MINDSSGVVETALLEASLKRIRLIENMECPNIATDESYDNKIFDLIYEKPKEKKRYPKKIIIILVAALTICFLIMFTVSAQIRTAVVDFFVEIYETFASFIIEDDSVSEHPKTIEIKYQPTYFKASEYQNVKQSSTDLKSVECWTKNDMVIDFSQYTINNGDITLDIEDTSYEIKYIGDQKIYYKIKNDSYTIKWLAYGYSFSLRCNKPLTWEEIEKIATSLEPVAK